MYKVLIVDDFATDRSKLKKVIHGWNDPAIQIAGECETAQQALAFVEEHRPDIMISDIEMPGMNGLEMAKLLKARQQPVKLIFCTLYNEFKYAQEAIRSNSYGYILKPIQSDDLYSCMRKVIGDLTQEAQLINNYHKLQLTLDQFKPALADNFLKELVYGTTTGEAELWNKARYLGVHVANGSTRLVYIEIDDYQASTAHLSTEEKQLYGLRIWEVVKQIVSRCGDYPLTRLDESHMLLIVSAVDLHQLDPFTYACANRLLTDSLQAGLCLSIAVSDRQTRLIELNQQFEQCKSLLRHKFTIGKGRIITTSDIPDNNDPAIGMDTNGLQKDIRCLVSSGSRADISAFVAERFNPLLTNADEAVFRNFCYLIVVNVKFILNEHQTTLSEVIMDENLIWSKLQAFETIQDAAPWIESVLALTNEHLGNRAGGRNQVIVDEIKRYVQANIDQNIGLDQLAAEMHFSPNYLNYVFKQTSGQTISDYITSLKIEEAKKLLANVRNKVQDISGALGYSHSAYFCSVFKKYTGVTPKEYREKVL